MYSIDARIAALAEAIDRRKMEQEAPVDDLSRSLFNLRRELAELDTLGKSALLYELNHGDPLEGNFSFQWTPSPPLLQLPHLFIIPWWVW